jgi:two-component system copper resistance phosphate regulon response regulator CusR
LRILVIEDDEVIGERLRKTLAKEGYVVDLASDGEAGLQQAQRESYSLIICDVMMPKRDGWSVVQKLRADRAKTPILMLTARDAVEDRVRGLDIGADDYLVKPFDFNELLARVRALLRRDKPTKSSRMTFDDLEIDSAGKTVRRNGEVLKLTPREYSLLEALVRNRGRVLSREVIIDRIWNDDESMSNTVNFHVTALRKKIDSGREKSLIETVHGFGYRIGD